MHLENIQSLTLEELRNQWKNAWGMKPHERVGRVMLEKSLIYKLQENLTTQQQDMLNKWVKQYSSNPKCFDKRSDIFKPGTQLVRIYNGEKHIVTVRNNSFEYGEKIYSSLSKIANIITGSKWNGYVFFGIK